MLLSGVTLYTFFAVYPPMIMDPSQHSTTGTKYTIYNKVNIVVRLLHNYNIMYVAISMYCTHILCTAKYVGKDFVQYIATCVKLCVYVTILSIMKANL